MLRKSLLIGAVGLALIVVASLPLGAATTPATKVGYIDLQKTLNDTKSGKAARGRLEAEKKKKQAAIDKEQGDLKKYKEELDKQRAVLKPEVLRQRERQLEEKVVKLQEQFLQYQQELAKREAELTRDIFKAASKVIETIAKRDGYTIILEKSESAVLWADDHYEITAEVNKRMDAGEGGK